MFNELMKIILNLMSIAFTALGMWYLFSSMQDQLLYGGDLFSDKWQTAICLVTVSGWILRRRNHAT